MYVLFVLAALAGRLARNETAAVAPNPKIPTMMLIQIRRLTWWDGTPSSLRMFGH